MELPTCYTKMQLHRRYLLEQGWSLKLDSKGRILERDYLPGFDDDNAGHPVSWEAFRLFWKQHYPKVVIRRPTADICDECFIFANRHKYRAKVVDSDGDGSDDDDDNLNKNTENNEDLETQEDIVLKAAKHVEMARKQRLLFNNKKREARADRLADKPHEDRSFCFVADFAQNMYVPNFSADQPGATYYYSPLNVYPFGIVDGSTEPSHLSAHVYYEGK